ncbi:MAG: LysR family transcriptional regulator [Bdellovibrionia bacterium]
MDANRLHYFLVVSETGSLRKAAELLRLSPAALSKAIKRLESESGLSLIIPSGRGIAITDDGRELARQSKPLIENLAGLARRVRDGRDSSDPTAGAVRLGSFEVFTTHFLRGLTEYLPEDTSLLLREVIPGEMEKALSGREVDFGITYLPIPTAGVEHHEVASVEMGIFGILEKFGETPFDELPFAIPIQPVAGTPTKVQGLDGWPDDRIPRKIKYRVTMMESALELARAGRAVGYFPKFVIELHNESVKPKFQLGALKAPKGLGSRKQNVFLSKRKNDPEGDIFKKLARAIRMTAR